MIKQFHHYCLYLPGKPSCFQFHKRKLRKFSSVTSSVSLAASVTEGDNVYMVTSTIVLKDRLDGFAGAAKLCSNPYVLYPIKLSITATCFSSLISLAMKYSSIRSTWCSNGRSFRRMLQSFQSAYWRKLELSLVAA